MQRNNSNWTHLHSYVLMMKSRCELYVHRFGASYAVSFSSRNNRPSNAFVLEIPKWIKNFCANYLSKVCFYCAKARPLRLKLNTGHTYVNVCVCECSCVNYFLLYLNSYTFTIWIFVHFADPFYFHFKFIFLLTVTFLHQVHIFSSQNRNSSSFYFSYTYRSLHSYQS